MLKKSWKLYVIQTKSGKLYTGITLDLEKRFNEHLHTKRGAKFFRTDRPKEIVFTENLPDRSSALKREAQIKKMSRAQKLNLVFSKKI
jgi:putative endonuclease